MATSSPFSFAQDLFEQFAARFAPPPWVVDEVQRRIVLLLNHVLGQEPEAMVRLKRQQGRAVQFRWRAVVLQLQATPAGLLERAAADAAPELVLHLTQDSPFDIARNVIAGGRPEVRIEGDVQLAAEVQWLADNVRWDIEEDLARIVGDAPAHAAAESARAVLQALRRFVGDRAAGPGAGKAPA